MKDLQTKLSNARKSFAALERALARDWQGDLELQDAVIQRFEFSMETCWKLYKAYFSADGVLLATPKAVFRQMHEAGFLTYEDTELALHMVDDRNLTSHTYNEELALDIASRVPNYAILLRKMLDNKIF